MARRIVGFIAVAYLARVIGTAGFGAINIGFTVLSYVLLAGSWGMNLVGVRGTARGERGDLPSTIISLRLTISLVSLVFVGIAGFLLPDRQTGLLIILFSLSAIPNAFMLDWYFQGREEMGIVGLGRFISAGVYLLSVLTFVHAPADCRWVAAGAVLGDVVNSALLYRVYRAEDPKNRYRYSLKGWRAVLSQSLPIGIGSTLGQVSLNLPILAIGIMMTNTDAGIFSAAIKLVFVLLVIDRVLSAILLPASSRYLQESAGHLSDMLGTAVRWCVLVTLPVAVGGTLLAGRIILLVYGPQYAGAVDLFRIMIWFFFFTVLHTIYSSGMIASGAERRYSQVMIVGTIIYAVTTIAGISMLGLPGAAAGFVVSEGATMLMMRRRLRDVMAIPNRVPVARALIAAGVMGTAVNVLSALPLGLIIAAAVLLYAGMLAATRAVGLDEMKELVGRIV